MEGIAITWADNSNGSWEYSTDGGNNWSAVGAVSDTSALLLTDDANTRIRFAPAENYNGTAQFSYRAWDRSDGNPNATAGVDVSAAGGTDRLQHRGRDRDAHDPAGADRSLHVDHRRCERQRRTGAG